MLLIDEFILSYDVCMSKDIYPYWKHSHFHMRTSDDKQCIADFRFLNTHLYTLLDVLNIPDRVVTVQVTVCEDIEALCILLKRLSFPCHYTNMTPMFGRKPMLAPQQLQLYSGAIHDEGAPLDSCFGFVDDTVYQIAGTNI